MGNYKIIFEDCSDIGSSLECFLNDRGLILINVGDITSPDPRDSSIIALDKPTAIKLVKVLKTEISRMGGERG
ncbi:hypothetical protein [Seonamhaeicola sp.]|uniref:hypothetical protein n=1 Tax=Seonamhaeicola sp. TaxID=1912245 RepID=UPI0035662D20